MAPRAGAPRFDFADIVRQKRAALEQSVRLSVAQRRVLTDIAQCRTATLGGHLDVCRCAVLNTPPTTRVAIGIARSVKRSRSRSGSTGNENACSMFHTFTSSSRYQPSCARFRPSLPLSCLGCFSPARPQPFVRLPSADSEPSWEPQSCCIPGTSSCVSTLKSMPSLLREDRAETGPGRQRISSFSFPYWR